MSNVSGDMLELVNQISLDEALEQYLESLADKEDASERSAFYEKILRFYVTNSNDTERDKTLHKESKQSLISEVLRFNERYQIEQKDSTRKSMKYADFHKEISELKKQLEEEIKKGDLDSYFTLELKINLLDEILDIWESHISYPVTSRFDVKIIKQ